ncbi:extracellular solute-binding protein [Actinomadura parmotrematis]|uniref:Extracellular solute-binding protein n=1 Tax=Actinomadura parmotrematis TaxID=2864039 RepID=A0ABS7G0R3_9ACTN|nr:extracellular solute-binding protein [Actinomadura parmotrematis]MBW8485980.1 extracellular solute-binding protein [Actinomadura parmotrematis]
MRLRGITPPGRGPVLALGALMSAVLALAGCDGGQEPVGTVKAATTLGPGEGQLDLVALPGYIENGSNDPRVDWVTPFQERTGCTVSWRTARDADDMATMLRDPNRRFDGVSAPAEVAGQLVAGDRVAPVNPDLVDGYKRLEPRLRNLLKQGGKFYGVPATWGSNLLMYDTRAVQPAPQGWAALFDPAAAARYSGKIVLRDSPLTIAEAALYLKSRDRKLKIKDPYALTPRQLAAAVRVLQRQRPYVQAYWKRPADAVGAFAGGQAVLGGVWPYQVDVLSRAGRAVQSVAPAEGVTGWTTSWMIGARAAHPNCMYQWMQWTASPDVQQQVAEWTGAAPANPQACAGDRLRAAFCGAYHVGDRGYLDKVIFAHAPTKACTATAAGARDGEGDCTDYSEWTKAWIETTKLPKK